MRAHSQTCLALFTCLVLPAHALGADDTDLPEHRAQEIEAKVQAWQKWSARRLPTLAAAAQDTLPIDATFYRLALDLDPATRTLRGDVRLEALVGPAALATVALDLVGAMSVDSVQVGGTAASFTHLNDILAVNLGAPRAPGQMLDIRVFYGGVPVSSSALHFDTRNGQALVWSLSEPFGSRTWWPCQDTPADKADSLDMDLTVPSALTAVSNGRLVGTTLQGSKKTWHWRERYPITPYLVSVAAHPYTALNTTYTPLGGGSMPITLWSFPDQVGLATPRLATTVQVLQRFAGLFGEYPFVDEKYDMAQFPWSGGMEHQTATSMCCWSVSLLVHEAAHQWFGDAVTCESFSDIWLNEGFATYSEALWDEGTAGAAGYAANIWANRFYGNGTIYVPPGDTSNFARVFDGNLTYNKASWVLHMLRGMLGDTTFFTALRAYATSAALRYGTATTADFQAVVESTSGTDLSRFFEQWIHQPYFPTYLVDHETATDGGGWRLELSIEQLQTHHVYAMPLTVRLSTSGGDETFVVQDSLAQQSFVLQTVNEPLSVSLDPDRWVLCTTEAALRSPSFERGVLLVNHVPWSTGSELVTAYVDSVFTAGYPYEFWDVYAAPTGGYTPQLPPPLGHGALPSDVLQNFSTLVWVGETDVEFWGNAAVIAYLRAGGNVLLLSRRGQEFLHPARSSYLGLRWAESPSVTLAGATPVHPGFVAMTPTSTQSGAAVFETSFDQPETTLLLAETQSFGVPRGIAVARSPANGGTLRADGGQFAFISGRPYRWSHPALRANVWTILAQLFGEPASPTGSAEILPHMTRLHAPVPNPFNPAVQVRFELAHEGRMRLAVYDLQGRLVRSLVDGPGSAGPGSVRWDGRDGRGRPVASGLYFFRLDAAGAKRTTKAVLLR